MGKSKFIENASQLDHRPAKCAKLTNPKGKVIVDVGCSFGWYERYAIENGCKKIYGIEPDTINLKKAKKDVPKAILTKGTAEKLPYKTNTFDLAVMFDVVEHLPKDTELESFKEVYRVLKKGGEFLLSTPNQNILSNLLDPGWYFGHRHYSAKKLTALFRKAGFKVVNIQYGGGIIEEMAILVFYFYKWVLHRSMPRYAWFENMREKEFAGTRGSMTIFIRGRK